MALLTIQGKGFIVGDIDFKFTPNGRAVVNLRVASNKSKKNEQTGEWDRTHEAFHNLTAWGELAEFINNNFETKTEIEFSGEEYHRKFERKDGSEGMSIDVLVKTVGAPIPKRDSGNSWGKNPASNHDVL